MVGSTAGGGRAVRVAAVPVGLGWLALAVARRQGDRGTDRRREPEGSAARPGRPSRGPVGAARPGSRTGGGMKAGPTTPVGRPVVEERAGQPPRCPVLEERTATARSAAGAGGQVRRRGAVLGLPAGPGLRRRGPGRLEINGGLGRTALLPARGAGSVEVASPWVEPGGRASRTAAGWVGPTVGLRPGRTGRTAAAQTPAVGLEAPGGGGAADPRPQADGKAPEGLIGRAQVRPAPPAPARRTVAVGHRVRREAGSPEEEGPRVAELGGASTGMTVLGATLLVGVRAAWAPRRRKDGLKPLARLQPPPSTVGW